MTEFTKYTVISSLVSAVALAYQPAQSTNQPPAEPNQWYKNLEASILSGKACAKYEIFLKDQGKICDMKDAAELYILLCKKELGRELLQTSCGQRAQRWGSDCITGAEEHVIESTKKRYTNLYWLVCKSNAPTKSDTLQHIKAAACGGMDAAPIPQQPMKKVSAVANMNISIKDDQKKLEPIKKQVAAPEIGKVKAVLQDRLKQVEEDIIGVADIIKGLKQRQANPDILKAQENVSQQLTKEAADIKKQLGTLP